MRWGRSSRKLMKQNTPVDTLRGIPLISLRYAVVVSEVLNFRHAANVLGATQSSVSARIKGLEDALGVILFERRSRGVQLTEAGRRFVAEVSVGIGHLDHATLTAGAISSGAKGKLAIGLISSLMGSFVCELRSRFRAAFPDVEQIVIEGASAQMVALVRNARLDLALVLDPIEAPDCHSSRLWTESYLVALPSSHALARADAVNWIDLAAEPFLLRTVGAGPQLFEHIVRRMAERGRSPHVRRCEVGRDTLFHMVANAEGVTLASESVRRLNCPDIVLRTIDDETERACFSAIWSPNNHNPALRNMLDIAFAQSKAHPSH
ncbi:LysR family transcriptional regulator [Agrobacterium sp. 22-211-1]